MSLGGLKLSRRAPTGIDLGQSRLPQCGARGRCPASSLRPDV